MKANLVFALLVIALALTTLFVMMVVLTDWRPPIVPQPAPAPGTTVSVPAGFVEGISKFSFGIGKNRTLVVDQDGKAALWNAPFPVSAQEGQTIPYCFAKGVESLGMSSQSAVFFDPDDLGVKWAAARFSVSLESLRVIPNSCPTRTIEARANQLLAQEGFLTVNDGAWHFIFKFGCQVAYKEAAAKIKAAGDTPMSLSLDQRGVVSLEKVFKCDLTD